ncbi:LysR family transcriptional regulator [Roseiarcus fermentans]|uniref:LysR family transcriptional regulator n=1 Tax=Roseiarcus fermentans TaxID=1473586 RepID=A0A366EY66_9HYPH|nr:LysR family transcriptional regulator [Roseiarcus fermentans]RBP06449.1 LysR family transcriptional regulator [Roseiarcus fermentans]
MAHVDIRSLDFTLLTVLASLLRTRRATDTARELAMTQSTVSHALARLRAIFGDPLFVRRPHGLAPTARALALAPDLDRLFALARDMVDSRAFDLAEAAGVVRIAASDYHCALLAAPLIARLGEAAPNLRLSFRPLVRRAAVEALRAGTVEVAIGRFGALPASVASKTLFDETYSVVAASRGHEGPGPFAIAAYLAARHVVVSLDGDLEGVVDAALRANGMRREVVAAVPYFLSALAAAAESDVVVTLPSRIAAAFAPRFGLSVFAPPLELGSFPVSAVVSAARGRSDLVRWLVDVVLPAARP